MTIRDNQLQNTSRVALHPMLLPFVTAVSLTQRAIAVILPNPATAGGSPQNPMAQAIKWVVEQASVYARTLAGTVSLQVRRVFADGVFASAVLAIDATAEKFKTTNAIGFMANGIAFTKAATTGLLFSGNYVINGANKWGAFLVQIASDGTISTKGALANAFLTETAAVGALPLPDAGHAILGYISVQAKNATWTANTDDMTPASDCVTAHFISADPNTTSISVLNANLVPVAGKEVQAVMAPTFSARLGSPTDVLVVLLTTDGTGALTDAYVRLGTRTFPLNGEA